MKMSYFLIPMMVFLTGFIQGQNKLADSTAKTHNAIALTNPGGNIDKLDRIKYIKPSSKVSSQAISICQSSIEQLESQVIDQKLVIQSQEMLIEQIMKRLEILEKKYEEEPLGIVSNIILKKEQ